MIPVVYEYDFIGIPNFTLLANIVFHFLSLAMKMGESDLMAKPPQNPRHAWQCAVHSYWVSSHSHLIRREGSYSDPRPNKLQKSRN